MIFWFLVQLAIMVAISVLTQPKISFPKKRPLGIDEFEFPTAEEGRSLPIVFGKRYYEGPNVCGYGDLEVHAVRKTVRVSMFNQKRQTLGYEYRMGMLLVLGLPCDGIRQFVVGEKCVWPVLDDFTTEAADGVTLATIPSNAYSCFGGDEREGGVGGQVAFRYGSSDQTVHSYLVTLFGANSPAYRGQTTVILLHTYVGNSAYIKPWKFLWKRTDIQPNGSLQWYPAKANIGDDGLNAVHCIRELLTDVEQGLGYGSLDIDDSNFQACANTCFTEGFGMHFNWDASTPCEDLIGKLLQIIDGAVYQNQVTGQFQIHLARDDYDPGTLEIFDEDDIAEIEEYNRPGFGEVTSKVVVKWREIQRNAVRTTLLDDPAVMRKQGNNIIITEYDYQEIGEASLANFICSRELKHSTSMLATMKLKCLKTMAHLNPNDVFKISWVKYGLVSVIVRITTIDYGSPSDEYMTIEVCEDVFGQAYNVYTDPTPGIWVDPISNPADPSNKKLIESPYFIISSEFGNSSLVDDLSVDASFMIPTAIAPNSDCFGFQIHVEDVAGIGYAELGTGSFTPSATLVNSLSIGAVEVLVDFENAMQTSKIGVNSLALIDDELLKVKSIDLVNEQVTLARGVLDTLPVAHNSGARIWFIGSQPNSLDTEYTYGNTPRVKFLTITGKGILAIGSAAYVQASFNRRMIRPYAPARLQIDSVFYPTHFVGQPTLSWRHRDRTNLTQLSSIVEYDVYADYGPEASTTYTLYIYDEDNVLRRTESGLTGTTYTYSEANERSDCGLGPTDPLNSKLRFVLKSIRGGYDSFQQHDFTVQRSSQGTSSSVGTLIGDLTVTP